jgi:hypothetical protein
MEHEGGADPYSLTPSPDKLNKPAKEPIEVMFVWLDVALVVGLL